MKLKLVLVLLIFLCMVPHVRAQGQGQGLLGDNSLYWFLNLFSWIFWIYVFYKMYSMLKRIEKKVGATEPVEPRTLMQRWHPGGKILALVICIFILSSVALIFGLTVVEQNTEASWVLMLLGFIGISASVFVLWRGREATAKSPWPAMVTKTEEEDDRITSASINLPLEPRVYPKGRVFCTNCGAESIDRDAKFCSKCGKKIASASTIPKPSAEEAVEPKKKEPPPPPPGLCMKCGAKNTEDSKYCKNCGNPLKK